MNYLKSCELCPRKCKVNRYKTLGYCKSNNKLKLSLAIPYYYEEPSISGNKGSGAIFFSNCNLRCIFCQNNEISHKNYGKYITIKRLSEIMLELQNKNVNNINLITPTMYIPHIIKAIKKAKKQGLNIPIVYNTSGYENASTIKLLDGLIDIYLPDYKYYDNTLAKKYSKIKDYNENIQESLKEMYRQVGKNEYKKGIMQKGIIVRHLIIPENTKDSKKILKYLHDNYKDNIIISIMNQYTPIKKLQYPELNKKVSEEEYNDIINYAIEIGIKKAYIQDKETVSKSFIPKFNLEGIIKKD